MADFPGGFFMVIFSPQNGNGVKKAPEWCNPAYYGEINSCTYKKYDHGKAPGKFNRNGPDPGKQDNSSLIDY
jgi:hypothetical protein